MRRRSRFGYLESLVAALPEAAVVYSATRELLAANRKGRVLLEQSLAGPEDPWRLGDVSLDALIHHVSTEEAELVETAHLDGTDRALVVRGARIRTPRGLPVVLVTLQPEGSEREEPRSCGRPCGTLARLIGGLAHEVRTPLTTMSGMAQVLRLESALPAELRHGLALVEQQVERADNLLRGMVALVRPSGDAAALPSSLNDVIRRAQQLMSYELRLGGRTLELDLEPDAPLVPGDPRRLLQLVLELVGQALRTGSGAPRQALVLRTRRGAGREAVLLLEVPAGSDLTGSRAAPLLQPLGAVLREERLPGGGSRFEVSLPTYPGAGDGEVAPGHIVIADGDLEHAMGAAGQLRSLGLAVRVSTSPEALRRRLARSPRAALLLGVPFCQDVEIPEGLARWTVVSAASGEERRARREASRLGSTWAKRDAAPAQLRELIERAVRPR